MPEEKKGEKVRKVKNSGLAISGQVAAWVCQIYSSHKRTWNFRTCVSTRASSRVYVADRIVSSWRRGINRGYTIAACNADVPTYANFPRELNWHRGRTRAKQPRLLKTPVLCGMIIFRERDIITVYTSLATGDVKLFARSIIDAIEPRVRASRNENLQAIQLDSFQSVRSSSSSLSPKRMFLY